MLEHKNVFRIAISNKSLTKMNSKVLKWQKILIILEKKTNCKKCQKKE